MPLSGARHSREIWKPWALTQLFPGLDFGVHSSGAWIGMHSMQ